MNIPEKLLSQSNFLKMNKLSGHTKVLQEIKAIKASYVTNNEEDSAKIAWCLEKICIVKKHYITAYKCLLSKEHFKSWNELDRADIELSFLIKHFDITTNEYNLNFIRE